MCCCRSGIGCYDPAKELVELDTITKAVTITGGDEGMPPVEAVTNGGGVLLCLDNIYLRHIPHR